jgi:hypothetical protein
MTQWWILLLPVRHTVLDGAPSHGKGRAGQGDVVFCQNDVPLGVLQAEGIQGLAKVDSIVKYFDTQRPELQSIQFSVLILYSYAAVGRGKQRQYRPAEMVP